MRARLRPHRATARAGEWRKAPGRELLETIAARLPGLELVAEDLGVITPEVTALRRAFALPGMRVLQFGFDGDPANLHLPHQHEPDAIVYTGTHDNDTTVGWYAALEPAARDLVRRYLGRGDHEAVHALLRAALASVGQLAVLAGAGSAACWAARPGSTHPARLPATGAGACRWRH